MAGWSTLRATKDDFGSHAQVLQTVLNAGDMYPNVTDIRDIDLTGAKRAMYADLTGARPLDATTDIDSLVDAQLVFFQQTLAMKQLAMHFHRLDKGEGSKDRDSWKYYDYEYEQRRKQFAGLTTSNRSGSTVRSLRVSL